MLIVRRLFENPDRGVDRSIPNSLQYVPRNPSSSCCYFLELANGVQNYPGVLKYLPRDNEIIQPTLLLQEERGDWGEQPDLVVESCKTVFDVPH